MVVLKGCGNYAPIVAWQTVGDPLSKRGISTLYHLLFKYELAVSRDTPFNSGLCGAVNAYWLPLCEGCVGDILRKEGLLW